MFKLSAPRVPRSAYAAQGMHPTWWTVDARAPEPEPVLHDFLTRALGILTQIVGMRLLAVSQRALQVPDCWLRPWARAASTRVCGA